jgi:hypothetical protein
MSSKFVVCICVYVYRNKFYIDRQALIKKKVTKLGNLRNHKGNFARFLCAIHFYLLSQIKNQGMPLI